VEAQPSPKFLGYVEPSIRVSRHPPQAEKARLSTMVDPTCGRRAGTRVFGHPLQEGRHFLLISEVTSTLGCSSEDSACATTSLVSQPI
jgi:hypothetical protein